MSDDTPLNWETLGQTAIGDVERPPVRPIGHYQAIINGRGKQDASPKKGTLFIEFPCQVIEALEDVDEEELQAAGGVNFSGRITFWLTNNSLYRFTDFGRGMGASDELNVLELAEWLATCGEPFVVQGSHELNDKNPEAPPRFKLDNPIPLSKWQERS